MHGDGSPFLGWGMQPGENEAVFYPPNGGATCIATSADHLLHIHQRIATARLRWLDD